MRFPRSLMIPLVMSISIASVGAQSPQVVAPVPLLNPLVARPLPGSTLPQLHFRAQIPGLTTSAKEGSSRKLTSPQILKRFDLFGSGPDSFRAPGNLLAGFTDLQAGDPVEANLLTMVQREKALVMANLAAIRGLLGNERCYTIRDYRFSRVTPGSDATTLSGSSVCEPASQVRLKSAVLR